MFNAPSFSIVDMKAVMFREYSWLACGAIIDGKFRGPSMVTPFTHALHFGQGAVSALLAGQVHDNRPEAHPLDSIFRNENGGTLPRHQRTWLLLCQPPSAFGQKLLLFAMKLSDWALA